MAGEYFELSLVFQIFSVLNLGFEVFNVSGLFPPVYTHCRSQFDRRRALLPCCCSGLWSLNLESLTTLTELVLSDSLS